MKDRQTHFRIAGLLVLAALIVGVIFVVAPRATTITNAASTEVYGIDILGLTKDAKNLPVQAFAAH